MNSCAMCGLEEMKILVAAYTVLGVHLSGRVIESNVCQCGRVGRILNGFGRGPDLYRERSNPTLQEISVSSPSV